VSCIDVEQLSQIGERFEIQLVHARRRLVIAARWIPCALEPAFDLKLPAIVLQVGARTVPVAGEPGLERCVVGEQRRRASPKNSLKLTSADDLIR
jgi:hypothetical protein